MPVEILTTIYSQHTIHLQRIGATEGLKVTPFLIAIENDVVSIFWIGSLKVTVIELIEAGAGEVPGVKDTTCGGIKSCGVGASAVLKIQV